MYFEEARDYLQKEVKDQYGRRIGSVAGIYTNMKDEVTALELVYADGDMDQIPFDQFIISGGNVQIIKPWKLKAADVVKQYGEALKRQEALEELLRTGEISKDVFDDLESQVEAAITQLKVRRDEVKKDLADQIGKLDAKKRALLDFLANAKVQHRLGDLDDQAFAEMVSVSNFALNSTRAEREDLAAMLDQLTRLGVERPAEVRPEPKPQDELIVKMEDDGGGQS